jgi:hypothetical protein
VLLAGLSATPALAHRDDYLNETFVFQTLEAHEFEPEVWLDFGPAKDDRPRFTAWSAAFEYGLTKHWMVDGFAGWTDPAGEAASLHRLRAETRVRFGEEGDRRVDVAASFEIEYEKLREPAVPGSPVRPEVEKDWSLTPRLVLSRDLPHEWNVTLNLDVARELHEGRSDRWTPGYALAARYPREAFLRYGVELRQDFGEERESFVVPQVWFSLPHEATLKIGAGIDLDGPSRQHFLRTVFEVEF